MSSQRATLLLVGTSHHTAPVAVRERLVAALGEEAAVSAASFEGQVTERFGPAVVLSTCNRLEVYCWTAHRRAAGLVRLLATAAGVAVDELRPHLYMRAGVDAARHLIRVAAGLDSLALGEVQILGQVRRAWLGSAGRAPLGAELDEAFRRALESARRIRTTGAFDRHPSVAAIAVHVADQALGGLAGRPAAVLGAGATGKAAARALLAAGAAHVHLINRSLDHAQTVAQSLRQTLGAGERITAASLDTLPQTLACVDAVVCATAAPRYVVSGEVVTASVAERLRQNIPGPLVLVDIAVPRDVEPAIREIPGVHVIDLDDLEARCALDGDARRREVARVEALAQEAAEACIAALRVREAVPDIVALRRHAEAIRDAELRRAAGRLRRLGPAERAAVEQLTHNIVQKLLHGPTIALRESTGGPTARAQRAALLEALSLPSIRHSQANSHAVETPVNGTNGRTAHPTATIPTDY